MDSKNTSRPIICLLAVAFACVGTCEASLIFGNLPGDGNYTGSTQLLTPADLAAVGVLTGSTPLLFNDFQGYFTDGTSLTLTGGIYSNASGAPGTEIAAFGPETLNSATATLVTFATTSTVILQANTEYWIEVDPPAVSWFADTTNSGNGTAPTGQNGSGYTSGGYLRSTNGGTSWSTNLINLTVEIDATSLPEPGSFAMLVCGCVLFAGRRLVRGR